MPERSKLGEAYVQITAEAGDLEASLSKAEQDVADFASQAEQDTNRAAASVGDTVRKVGDTAEGAGQRGRRSFSQLSEQLQQTASRQVGVITGFAGITAATAGVAIGAFRMGRAIRSALDNDRAKTFATQLDGASEAIERVAAGLRGVDASTQPVAASIRQVLDVTRETERAIASQAEQAVKSRGVFERLADTARFGIDGFTGTQSTILDVARDELDRTGRASARALRDAVEAAARLNDELVQTTRTNISDALAPPTGLEQAYRNISEQVGLLRDRLKDASETQKDSIRNTIASLGELRQELTLRDFTQRISEEEDRLAQVRRESEAQAQAFRDEAEAIRREALEPAQQAVLAVQDRIAELQDQLEGADSRVTQAILEAIRANNTKLEQLRSDAKDASLSEDAIARGVRQGVEQAIRNDLARVTNDLTNVVQGLRDVEGRL